MSFPFYIASRYLLSKKSHHAINIISGVSVCGVAIATAALVCILSVFNGFQDMVAGLFPSFDPQLKVLPKEGKWVPAAVEGLATLRKDADVAVYTETVEDQALLMMNNRQVMATVKGVEDNFEELTGIDNILIGDGVFELHADVIDYGILGSNLLMQLGLPTDFSNPIQVFAPRKGERIDLNDPRESLNEEELYSPKVGFMVKQNKYDSQYVITNIAFARRLFERQGYVSAVELKLKDGVDTRQAKERIRKMLGEDFQVLDRYEQQEDTFKIMQIEKLISYLFLTFILAIACFNIIGSLSMLIIDKKQDAITLRNLTGVQTCALPIYHPAQPGRQREADSEHLHDRRQDDLCVGSRHRHCIGASPVPASAGVRIGAIWQQRGQLHHQCLPRQRTCGGHRVDLPDRPHRWIPFRMVPREADEQTGDI